MWSLFKFFNSFFLSFFFFRNKIIGFQNIINVLIVFVSKANLKEYQAISKRDLITGIYGPLDVIYYKDQSQMKDGVIQINLLY